MISPGTKRLFIIIGIILAGVLFLTLKAVYKEFKDDGYVNAIELNEISSIKLNGALYKEWLLTEQGKLFCVSLASKEILVVDINNGNVIKVFDLKKKFKEVKVVSNEEMVYFIFGYQNIAKININTLEYNMIEVNDENKLENNFIFLHGDKLITSDILMDLKMFNLSTNKIDFSKRVESFNRIKIYNDLIYCYASGDSIYAYDINTLELKWEYVKSTQHSTPGVTFNDDKVYFNDVSKTSVFNTKTGEKIDEYPLKAQGIDIIDENMYSVLWGKSMSRVDPSNGDILWTIEIERYGFKVIDDYLIVNDRAETQLKKIKISDGSLVWASPFIDDYLKELEVYNNYYVIRSRDGAIHLVNAETGQELWRYKKPPFHNNVSNYKIHNNHLIITDGGKEVKIYELPN